MLKIKKLSLVTFLALFFSVNYASANNTYDIPSVSSDSNNEKNTSQVEKLPPIPENVISNKNNSYSNSRSSGQYQDMPSSSTYQRVADSYLGMTPDEIRDLRRMIDSRSKAASELPFTPKPVTGSIMVSLAPGSTPPVIRPFINSTTSFVVLDSTGQTWPVENFNVGNSEAFKVSRLDLSDTGSSFTINALDMYAHTNLILKLKDLATPVVIDLVAGQKERDERVEVRVIGRGPNATLTGKSIVPATDSTLLQVLDGINPKNSKVLSIKGDYYSRAWLVGDELMVRTSLKIISPASKNFVSSSDGTTVYVFTPTSQLVGLDKNNIINLSITGW